MSYCKVVEHKGVKIVYTDIENTNGNEAIPAFDAVQKLVAEFPDKSVLSCVNATNARFNKDLLSLILNSIIAATGRKMKLLDSVEDGKEWLYQYEINSVQQSETA